MEYQHGGDIYSQEVDLDFSANLNPFGLPEAVRRAAADSLGDCTVYPDSSSRKLTAALAAYHGVPQEQVICGNGAADLIFGLALALKPKRALVTARLFPNTSRHWLPWTAGYPGWICGNRTGSGSIPGSFWKSCPGSRSFCFSAIPTIPPVCPSRGRTWSGWPGSAANRASVWLWTSVFAIFWTPRSPVL